MATYLDPNEAMVSSVVTTAPAQDGGDRARYASNDEFFALAGKVVTEEVFVPLINRSLLVRALTANDVQRAREDANEMKNGRMVPRKDREFATMIAFYATVNADGTRFFARHQIEMLHKNTNYAAIQPLIKAALRLSGLDDEAEETERKKAFEGARDDD